jgi:uncharacterized RDD family membrane protein YckC
MMDDSLPVGQLRVVTPDGTALVYESASVMSRVGARLLDVLLQGIILVVFGTGAAALGSGNAGGLGDVLVGISYFIFFVVILLYHPFFEVFRGGQSPGKSAVDIRVIRTDGRPVRVREAMLRSAADLVEVYSTGGVVAIVSSVVSRQGQRLGDHLAGTVVVSNRMPMAPHAAQFMVLNGFEGLVDALDVSRVTAADYELVRVTLLRASSLPHEVRFKNASMVVASISPRCNLELGPEHHPEIYLSCIAAAFQRRSDRQLQYRHDQRRETLGDRGQITAFTRIGD